MTFGEELQRMMFDGRHRAQVRTRLMRRLDQQLAALTLATNADIERVRQDAQKLIDLTDMFLATGTLVSMRDSSQTYKVRKKFDDLKDALARRIRLSLEHNEQQLGDAS
jgi:hypothetical protein